MIEQWQNYWQLAEKARAEFEALSAELLEQLGVSHAALLGKLAATTVDHFETLNNASELGTLAARQSRYVMTCNEHCMEAARGTADILNDAREGYEGWIERTLERFVS